MMVQVLVHIVVHVARSRSCTGLHVHMLLLLLLLLKMLERILGAEQRICRHHQTVVAIGQLWPMNGSRLQRNRVGS